MESTALDELLAVQGILGGTSAAIDDALRALPPIVCTWQGTARDAYALNLDYIRGRLATMVASLDDARAAVSSAMSAS